MSSNTPNFKQIAKEIDQLYYSHIESTKVSNIHYAKGLKAARDIFEKQITSEVSPIFSVYDFDQCPEQWKDKSTHGGDEDYIVVAEYPLSEEVDFMIRLMFSRYHVGEGFILAEEQKIIFILAH